MKYYSKMKSIIIYFLLVMAIFLNYKVEAANFSVQASKSEVTVGDTFTVTINGTGLTGKYTIKGSSNISISGETTPWIENTSVTVTCTTKDAGTATITVTPETVADANTGEDLSLSAKSVSVNVKAKETTQTTTTTTTQTSQTTQTKSSEARLKNLGITPNDFSGFKKDKTEYSTEVPNDVTEVNVYATAVDSKAKISGTGKVSLKEGDNTVKVTVTAEAGNTKVYTLTIKRKTAEEEAENAGEARLKNLGIKPEEYDFSGFDSEKTEYSVEVPNEVEEIEVYATAMNSNAQITGTGMIELKEGKNELKVEVIAEDGTKKTYTINVTRKEADGAVEQFGLSTLLIEGLTLEPSFEVGTYEYRVELSKDISSLNIQAEANEENATVEIIGNENLQEGENIITILVTNKETEEVITYQIIVNKNLSGEEVAQTSWLKPSTWGKEEKIKIAIIIVLIILIICAIILKIKMGKEKEQTEEREFPGADELDKAIAEHQELSSEEEIVEEEHYETTNVEDIDKSESEPNYIQEIAASKFCIEDNQENSEVKPKRRGRHF